MVCGHCLVTVPLTAEWNIKMDLIVFFHSGVDSVTLGMYHTNNIACCHLLTQCKRVTWSRQIWPAVLGERPRLKQKWAEPVFHAQNSWKLVPRTDVERQFPATQDPCTESTLSVSQITCADRTKQLLLLLLLLFTRIFPSFFVVRKKLEVRS